jgi:hypothetical protein
MEIFKRLGKLYIDLNLRVLTASFSHHIGFTAIGNDFGRAFKDYDNDIIAPYNDFLRHIYRKPFGFLS